MAGYREFVTGEVLTAANVNDFLMEQSVMVFANGTARDAALTAVLREGMLAYNLDTKALEVYDGTAWGPVVTAKEKRIEAFTGSGNWTVPAGVTYAIAHMRGGGGGIGQNDSGGNGGTSSVDFSSGLVQALGGNKGLARNVAYDLQSPGQANTGNAGLSHRLGSQTEVERGGDAQEIVRGAAVTPAAVIAVVVGAGGTAGTNGSAGGSGYVYIEFLEEI